MSGGSYDYAYWKVEEFRESVLQTLTYPFEEGVYTFTPDYSWFLQHLLYVAAAMKAIEWEHSGDTSYAATQKAFDAVRAHLKEV